MKINKVFLSNYKTFINTTIDLNGKSTIIFGVNGVGKSSILRAINLNFANIIGKLVNNRFKQDIKLEETDISFGKSKCHIGLGVSIDDSEDITYCRYIERSNMRRTHNKKELDEIVSMIQDSYNGSNLPVFVNYSTNRLVQDVPVRIRTKHNFDNYATYEKAIESKIDFRLFFEWFRNQEDYENQKKIDSKNLNYIDKSLQSVKIAVLSMLDDFKDLRVDRNPLSMKITKDNKSFKVEQLSDGEKCTIALFGDLARRLALANPALDNPLEGRGVVLIDEIELHMHPQWQRKILSKLKVTFPNIQFIIATHSPQVLGEATSDYNVFMLETNDGNTSIIKYENMEGFDSNYILEELMNTPSIKESTNKLIEEVYDLIHDEKFDLAEDKLNDLSKILSNDDFNVATAQLLIKKGRMKI